jgi:ATP-dependent Lon protease
MSDKNQNIVIKKDNNQKNEDIILLVERKIDYFKDIIQKTIIHVQKNKSLNILGLNEVNTCVDKLCDISKKIENMNDLYKTAPNTDVLIANLQIINNDLSSLFKLFGTDNLDDLLLICFGNNNKITVSELESSKFDLLKKYFHPISYKLITKNDENKGNKKKNNEEIVDDKIKNLDCFEIEHNYKQFHIKIYGIKVYVYNSFLKKGLMVYGIIDNIVLNFLSNKYTKIIQQNITNNVPVNDLFDKETVDIFMSSLILKDYLLYDNHVDVFNKLAGYISNISNIKQKAISQIVKEFMADDLYSKRITIIQLLIKSVNYENQYLAYLLYDLLSNDTNGNIDTIEQTVLFDSFPWPIKIHFKNAMKKTVQYTNELSNFDINKIPLEQQICLLNAPDSVKEKAMIKLKEVKAKSEDSGSKARQYLDCLLKIPFNIYKREPILHLMSIIKEQFKELYTKYEISKLLPLIPLKDKYTSIEIKKYITQIKKKLSEPVYDDNYIHKLKFNITHVDKKTIVSNITKLNSILSVNNIEQIKVLNKKKDELKNEIETKVDLCYNKYTELLPIIDKTFVTIKINTSPKAVKNNINKDIEQINDNLYKITEYMITVKETLDKAAYGHNKAKRQIERVIGQWINGENISHVLGFEGNPGVGKTTLAKGLADCLKDENGVSRPYAIIPLGGDSSAATLVGHSYTYVGSTFSQIVQILMDKKCMNPIIIFDEVDKISKTEHGKEVTGILTHLLDTTQNNAFQDKYFAGIDFDLSKVLFILSYNDSELIDKILLDRVNRIRFDTLSIEDKIVVCNNHLLPDLYKKIGLEGMIHFSDETLTFIIKEYTLEPGVRKLKEKLFEIVGEINLNILKNDINSLELPIKITVEDVKTNYFKDKREVKTHKIHTENKVGVINALWANSSSQGGVLPLQVSYIPSNKFLDLTLTGSMGDVMKESISVSLTNAWNLTNADRQKELIKKYNDTKNNNVCGIHIHCPDISTKKDGPSATTAFTVAIYSLFNNIKIKNYFGITGETSFNYELTEIGGLQEKIIHSIPAGIKEFIYPVENQSDFNKIMDKYKDNKILDGIKFHSISHIHEVLDLILEK